MTYRTEPLPVQPPPVTQTPREVEALEKNERFFVNIKDQIELTKGVTLGLAVIAASHALLGSGLDNFTKIAGALVCIILGFWTIYCAVALFCQHRMKIRGLPIKAKIARVAQYTFLCAACLFAGDLALQIGKHASASELPTIRASTPEGRTAG